MSELQLLNNVPNEKVSQKKCFIHNIPLSEKLNEVEKFYFLYGMGVIPFINDVVDLVMEEKAGGDTEHIAFHVGLKIMTLLQYRIKRSNKETLHINRAKLHKEQEQKDMAYLNNLFDERTANVVYANVMVTYSNTLRKRAESFDEAVKGIGTDEYNEIVYRAVNNLPAKSRVEVNNKGVYQV